MAELRDALKERVMRSNEDISRFGRAKFGHMLAYLQDQCGYIVARWPDPNPHPGVGRKPMCYRITGRLAWTGGVAEDYTVPR